MSTAITLEQAEAKITFYLAEEEKVAAGTSISTGDKSIQRARLSEIGDRLKYWIGIRDQLVAAQRNRVRRVALSDWEPS